MMKMMMMKNHSLSLNYTIRIDVDRRVHSQLKKYSEVAEVEPTEPVL